MFYCIFGTKNLVPGLGTPSNWYDICEYFVGCIRIQKAYSICIVFLLIWNGICTICVRHFYDMCAHFLRHVHGIQAVCAVLVRYAHSIFVMCSVFGRGSANKRFSFDRHIYILHIRMYIYFCVHICMSTHISVHMYIIYNMYTCLHLIAMYVYVLLIFLVYVPLSFATYGPLWLPPKILRDIVAPDIVGGPKAYKKHLAESH